MRVRGMTMAAVLTDDPECPNLIAFSVYDMKPVHFLSMACTGLKWIEKWQKVFNKSDVEQNVSMSFLQTEVTDMYNNGMNDVDVADQLWNTYRINQWMRKRKWWWAIWMWGCQISSCECLRTVQNIASVHLEKRKETSIIPIWIPLSSSAWMALLFWRKRGLICWRREQP